MYDEKEKLITEFKKMLDDVNTKENDIQEFIETYSQLIPTPFLLGHALHFNSVISKFKLSDSYITDFAYMTKCTDYWNLVLIELEDSHKKIFTNNKNNTYFHNEFNHAYDQITSWKNYIEQNKECVLKKITKLKLPIKYTPIRIKYVLIIGRNSDKNTEEKINMFAQKSNDDVKVMTYDSIISMYKHLEVSINKMVLSHWKGGFKVKHVPDNLDTSIFASVKPEYLDIGTENTKKLIAQDYQIDRWRRGYPLMYNSKYDAKTYKEKATNILAKVTVTDDEIERKFD
ncbi:hypothetical protein CPAST_c17810 [Clostridium pasteurianum DSM 525 = ATCC 6013]|uniref:Shedu protein SduA C-terminal domain-containing protein n=1 Tax=Clostridium pasteurianum DSM 525 = ATCC 6013 TaxID=1262449 RepID=A0A0H3J1S5_CLOPA|nr:Shedu immune nuclease family protein [Clostridium pasteurianum]AJA47851.1 hypothetical protein CPAST_c17810 [Clostridium pasteurianum DSM 525 = ATCC 6013]AJA51839.1 hypothetical protein CLPA_c17810 [Clostridium pasteurianum DSM 525 = ATCC 6013]AOZ75142.1 hypothetical protein AQ983_08630 [Clostridium pasteurianum DSM 525 = ATCC 6013]AOZ78937.1 hypothetical protein AQ984_08620 [Clostridium pasteurianum]ELP59752.1 hypothetical protein F502_07803 [Clostridium pasteurianum DSM 525 = ATCC 6013]